MNNAQEIASAIKAICKTKNIKLSDMFDSCNINKNMLSTMKTGNYLPKLDNLCKIADYLDISLDYLVGRTECAEFNTYQADNQSIAGENNVYQSTKLSEMEEEMLSRFRKLSFDDKLEVMMLISKKGE